MHVGLFGQLLLRQAFAEPQFADDIADVPFHIHRREDLRAQVVAQVLLNLRVIGVRLKNYTK